MKKLYTVLIFYSINFCIAQNNPEPFIPEITTQFPNVRDIAISPNSNEVLLTTQSVMGNLSAIICVKKMNNIWSKPQVATFSGKYFDLEPFYSHDGLKLYFVSKRPLNENGLQPKDFDIWFVERSNLDAEWSNPKNIGAPINTEHDEFYPSISNNGNFYFTRDDKTKNRKDDIYLSIYENGKYQNPVPLPESINTDSYEYNAFIAPDESYLIFGGYNRKDGLGSGDMYISKRTKTGWTEAENMGVSINSDKMDYCPFVIDGVLYFTSKRGKTQPKQEGPLDIEELLKEFNNTNKNSSNLYHLNINHILKN